MKLHYNWNQLRWCVMTPTKRFWKLPNFKTYGEGENRFAFQNNHTRILAVAHLDSVQKMRHFARITTDGERWVMSPSLDDRLGVYIIMFLLKELGLKYDILLTDNEESGKSTAQYFKTRKKYNWMFEFDRDGKDAVVYDFWETDFNKLIEETTGFSVSRGSNSDIAYLYELGCKGINFSTGLVKSEGHGQWSRANLEVLQDNIARFLKFYNAFRDTHLPHEKKTYQYSTHAHVNSGISTGKPCKHKGCYTVVYPQNVYGGYCYKHRQDEEEKPAGLVPLTPSTFCSSCHILLKKERDIKLKSCKDCRKGKMKCVVNGCNFRMNLSAWTQCSGVCNNCWEDDKQIAKLTTKRCLEKGCERLLTAGEVTMNYERCEACFEKWWSDGYGRFGYG